MREDVLGLPDQIRDALWRIDSAALTARRSSGLVVAGMGGSAVGADLARSILGDRLERPLVVWRDYGLPAWVGSDWAVLASSYSGQTEETLSAFAEAGRIGAHRWAAGTGGTLAKEARAEGIEVVGLPGLFQPRAAVAYMVVTALHAAHLAGVAPDLRSELEPVAAALEDGREELAERAADLAARLGDAPVVIQGADPTAALARRWANQLNENAKQFAFAAPAPEAGHNLTEAWPRGTGQFTAVFLEDPGQHPRNRRRLELGRELVAETGAVALPVECEGETSAERLLRGVMLGDLVSLEVARLRDVDPVPVDGIQDLKRRLEETR